jgi:23S rRNA (guanosine2251-2'-O)-methyltransferase
VADYIVGKRAILEALAAGVPISCVFVEASFAEGARGDFGGKPGKDGKGGRDHKDKKRGGRGNRDERNGRNCRNGKEKPRAKSTDFEELIETLREAGANIEYVSRKKLDSMLRDKNSEGGAQAGAYNINHQGIVAKVAAYKYAELSQVIKDSKSASDGPRLIIVCDHITDVGNFGAVVRSAEALGASAVVIPNRRCATVNAAVYKTSAGAVSNLPIVQVVNIAAVLDELKEAGFWVAGATEHATSALMDANLKGDIVLVMGSEGSGISRLVLEKCDFTVAIPQLGHVESLNVAQAASVCIYEWLRQNKDALLVSADASEQGEGVDAPAAAGGIFPKSSEMQGAE